MKKTEIKGSSSQDIFSGAAENNKAADQKCGEDIPVNTFFDLIEMMDIALWQLDTQYRVVWSNKKAERLYGTNLIGDFCYHAAAKKDEVCGICPARMVFDGQEKGRSEHKRINTDGEEIYIDHIAAPIKDASGNVTGALVLIIDITLRKAQEKELEATRINLEELVAARTKELKASRAKYRALYEKSNRAEKLYLSLLNSSADAIVIYDLEGQVQYISPSFTEIFGWQPDELLGKRIPFVPEPEQGPSLTEIRRVLSSNVPTRNFPTKRFTKDGRLLDIYLSASKYDGVDGTPIGLLVILKDVTSTKMMEAQLRQALKMESVGQLAGGVAHDFNNMLGVILGHTDLAMNKMDPSHPSYDNLREIHGAVGRSAEITRQLLAFARKQTIVPKVLDLNLRVEKTLKMLQRLVGEDVELAWVPGNELWQIKIDPVQIDQILANLCINARDAITGIGRITVETGNNRLDKEYCLSHAGSVPGEYVSISVSDNGQGMDKEAISHIFEPFYTTKKVGKGTGLGLATVYGAVKQNNGFIYVYSEPGHGTTMKIYLPRHVGDIMEEEQETAKAVIHHRRTVLLAEDDPRILKMAEMMLVELGYTVLAADTPSKAIRQAVEFKDDIHLLLTDVIMPEMNGRELAKRIQDTRPHLKCLFMSGYTANVIAHQCILDDGMSFIQKPFSLEELSAKIFDVLSDHPITPNSTEE